jgi:hypothetical protein
MVSAEPARSFIGRALVLQMFGIEDMVTESV